MTRHVDELLTAYVFGQLDQLRAGQVYLHLSGCSRCRNKLLRIEELERRLKSTLSLEPIASRSEVNQWWLKVRSGEPTKVSRREYQVLASGALAAMFIIVPIIASWSFSFPMAQYESALTFQSTELIRDTVTIDISDGSYLAPRPAAARVSLRATIPPMVPISAAPSPLASSGR